jgi:hypothetical protein
MALLKDPEQMHFMKIMLTPEVVLFIDSNNNNACDPNIDFKLDANQFYGWNSNMSLNITFWLSPTAATETFCNIWNLGTSS